MTRINSFARIAAVALLALAVAAPTFAARGRADFTTYVALGDSITAGYNAGSLNEHHQLFSYPSIIARQAGLRLCPVNAAATDPCFAQPLITFPGLPAGELVLALTSTGTTIAQVPGQGSAAMFGFGRAYNNLAVPGYTATDAITRTGAAASDGLGQVILRGRGTMADQAASLHPTFVTVWLGANDLLNGVASGNPNFLTPTAAFTTAYNTILDKIVAANPDAGIMVGTLPTTLGALPLTSTIPGVLINPATNTPVLVGGQPVPLIFDAGGGNIQPLPPGSVVLLSALARIRGGAGIPPALAGVPPFNTLPLVGQPLTNAETITPAEAQAFLARAAEFNAAITAAAASHNAGVVDINGFYNRIATATATNPIRVGPFAFTNSFPTGGLFALDGTHFSDIGYILFANEWIKAINATYGTHIPLAGLHLAFQNNDPDTADALGFGLPSFDAVVGAQMINFINVTSAPAQPSRRRVVH